MIEFMHKSNKEQETKQNYEQADAWHQEKSLAFDWAKEIETFAKSAKKGGNILDVGSGGSGRDIATFQKMGFVVEALDYSGAAVAALRQRFPGGNFYEADMRATGLPDANYDGIWACASLLNIPKSDVPSTLLEFNRLLKEGGALFISVKKGEGERMVPDKAGERFFDFFSELELEQDVHAAGFKVKKIETVDENVYTGKEDATTTWICVYAVK